MDALNLPFDLFLIETLSKGALLLLLAGIAAFALRRGPAAMRHSIWSLAFAALLLLPFGAVLLPDLRVALPVVSPEKAPAVETIHAETPLQALAQTPRLLKDAARAAVHEAAPLFQSAPPKPTVERSAVSRTTVLVAAWGVGAALLLGALSVTLLRLARTARRAEPVSDPAWTELAEIVCARLSITRPVRLLHTPAVAVPMTFGVRRPVLLLPAEAEAWPEDQREVVLLHELLHVRRNDFLMHLVAQVARALHWFNPLAWYASRRLLAERERACDDGVLSLGIASSQYADHLLDMAKSILTGREASTAALAMGRPSELRTRISAILDPAVRRKGLSRAHSLSMAAAMVAVVLPIAAARPYVSGVPLQDVPGALGLATLAFSETPPAVAAPATGSAPEAAGMAVRPDTPIVNTDADAYEAQRANLSGSGNLLNPSQPADTTDEEFEAQKKAVFALSQLPREQAVPRLAEIARTHRNPAIRAEALFWLGQTGGSEAAELLMNFARNDANAEVQKKAIFGLSQLEDGAGIPRLMELARTHPNPSLRGEAIFWIGQQGGADVVDELEQFARNDASAELQKKAIFALSQVEDGAGASSLANLARTLPSVDMRAESIFWLGQAGSDNPRTAEMLEQFARNDASPEVQKKAIYALSQLDDNAGVPRLIDLARTHRNTAMRSEAVFWLGQSDDPRAADVLMEIANGR